MSLYDKLLTFNIRRMNKTINCLIDLLKYSRINKVNDNFLNNNYGLFCNSIRGTLNHIYLAEMFWLLRINKLESFKTNYSTTLDLILEEKEKQINQDIKFNLKIEEVNKLTKKELAEYYYSQVFESINYDKIKLLKNEKCLDNEFIYKEMAKLWLIPKSEIEDYEVTFRNEDKTTNKNVFKSGFEFTYLNDVNDDTLLSLFQVKFIENHLMLKKIVIDNGLSALSSKDEKLDYFENGKKFTYYIIRSDGNHILEKDLDLVLSHLVNHCSHHLGQLTSVLSNSDLIKSVDTGKDKVDFYGNYDIPYYFNH